MATYSNIYIDQGSSYSSVIDVKDPNGFPLNLSGYLSRGQIRKNYTSTNFVSFATNTNQATSGKVSLSLTSAQTSALKPGRYVYSVEVYNNSGHVIRVAEGQVEINPGSANNDADVVIPPVQTLNSIINDTIDTRTVVTDKLLSLNAEEEERFYTNTKLFEKLALKAPLASPEFSGTPLSTTATADTNTAQIATTAYVLGQASSSNPLMNGTVAVGTSQRYSRADHVHPTDTSRAPLNSPNFSGTPSAPNPGLASNDTRIATTAFVNSKLESFAPLASPTFTGNTTFNAGATITLPNNSITSAMIVNGTITDADINSSADIAGSKITPNFGTGNIITTGTMLVGHTTSFASRIGTTVITPQSQVIGTGDNAGTLLTRFSADAASARLSFAKSRSTTIGDHAIVSDGNDLGLISFGGSDGVKIVEAARIHTEVDGTPNVDGMPGRLIFSTTASGAATPTERMSIASNGIVYLGNGTTSGTPNATTLSATGGSGTDTAGANFTIRAGIGTGIASGGSIVFNASSPAAATTSGTTTNTVAQRARLLPAGQMIIGSSTSAFATRFGSNATDIFPNLQILSNTAASAKEADSSAVLIGRFSSNADGSRLYFTKSRSATTATHGLVSSGDNIGLLSFGASDGSRIVESARISVLATGTPAADKVAGVITLSTTADTANAVPVERMRIDNTGNVGIGTNSPDAKALLHLSSTTKGFLPPVMTTAQRNAMGTVPAGLMIYNTTANAIQFYNGTAWQQLSFTAAALT